MQFHVLAVDYDGTIAHNGEVDEATLAALRRLRETGRKLVLVSGRRLEPLQELFAELTIFEKVVAENGALLYNPHTNEEKLLSDATPPEFAESLSAAGVDRLETGRVIVATWQPYETIALELIREMGLELQIIFNKDAVMILPTGINKAVGLKIALEEMGISPLNTVAVGDAENDLAMLNMCGASAAVANALQTVKDQASIKLEKERGEGVSELIELIVSTDLTQVSKAPKRNLRLHQGLDGVPLTIPLVGESIFVTGGPGGGKSKFALTFLERLSEVGAQCVIIDPEGDYQDLSDSIVLGTADRAPDIEEVIGVLRQPSEHCVVSFFSIPKPERPAYFDKLHRALADQRSRTGRPHWIIVDESHYASPRDWEPAKGWHEKELKGFLFITAFQEEMSVSVLQTVDWIISIAEEPRVALEKFCNLVDVRTPDVAAPRASTKSLSIAWHRANDEAFWFHRLQPKDESQRHMHSYYDGEMDKELRFVFRGPERKLALEVQNLKVFMQIGGGVDDETWEYHLNRDDYASWFENVIKDGTLAEATREIGNNEAMDAGEKRKAIFQEIRKRFEKSPLEGKP